jgi:hypothetical protein
MRKLILILWLGCGLLVTQSVSGAEIAMKDYVQIKDEKVMLVSDGKESELTDTMEFPYGIKILTNGTFTVNQGKERTLHKGQKLDQTGMLYSPDGSVAPVMDHVVQIKNRALLFKDGESQPLANVLQLEDGTRVMPDGTLNRPNGQIVRLLDGQMLLMTGVVLPSRDTIMFTHGKVVLQKDGSRISLLPAQTLMMNDGTKVFGDGRVLLLDGKSIQLVEDQVLVVEGVLNSALK